jgi:hypothetical protein
MTASAPTYRCFTDHVIRPTALHNGHYANPSLYLEGVTIKNDPRGPTDKEMHLSLSVRLLIKGEVAATHYVLYICL